jgi:predicted transcriptional regulator
MKSILLKIDDELFNEVEKAAKELNTSKTGYIKTAILAYKKAIGRKNLEIQLAKEVALIKANKNGLAEVREWEEGSLRDLSKYLDKLESE